jgi:1-acyl-sn-glycerol-3-phosphate acyltransferase
VDLYAFGKAVSISYLRTVNRVTIIGADRFPKTDGVLLCSNHISNLDPPLVGGACPRPVHFMAKSELFSAPILKTVLPKVNAFPVRRGMSDRQSLRTGLKILEDGGVVGLFPEGTRSKTGEVGQGLAGAGFFALRSHAPVVPCAIIGSYKPFGKIKIIYGAPIDIEKSGGKKVSVREATDQIMKAIANLVK